MKRHTCLLLMVSLAATSVAFATTYVRVEKDGTKTYSDRPLPGGQPVELSSAQTYTPSTPAVSSGGGDASLPSEQRLLQQMDDFSYSSCALTPANDSTFTNPENVQISLSSTPALRAGDRVTLSVDGQAIDGNRASYVLQPANRGTHSVQATIRDSFGRVLCSASTSFHVMRPSLNLPGRR
jgi:hypothetical protein